MLIHKNVLKYALDIIKVLLGVDFDNLVDFLEAHIKKWLVTLVNGNEDQLDMIE